MIRYNMLICPFKMCNRSMQNPLTVIKNNMFDDVPIIYNNAIIGRIVLGSVRVGSDGFYGDVDILIRYERIKLEFRDIVWNIFSCGEDRYIVESIARIILKQKTR